MRFVWCDHHASVLCSSHFGLVYIKWTGQNMEEEEAAAAVAADGCWEDAYSEVKG